LLKNLIRETIPLAESGEKSADGNRRAIRGLLGEIASEPRERPEN
jgi:hypothetical protein